METRFLKKRECIYAQITPQNPRTIAALKKDIQFFGLVIKKVISKEEASICPRIACQKQPPEVLYKKGVFRSATLLKKRFWHRCFPVNFAKFLRTPF